MKELIEKIKSKGGYWRVIIRPTIYKEDLIFSLDKCKEIIEHSRVNLRGWSYPHIGRSGIKVAGDNSVDSFCDWPIGSMFEYWRFYQTGQFVHYFSMREDLEIFEDKKNEIRQKIGLMANSINKFLSI